MIYKDFEETIDEFKKRVDNLQAENDELKQNLCKLENTNERYAQLEQNYQNFELVKKE